MAYLVYSVVPMFEQVMVVPDSVPSQIRQAIRCWADRPGRGVRATVIDLPPIVGAAIAVVSCHSVMAKQATTRLPATGAVFNDTECDALPAVA